MPVVSSSVKKNKKVLTCSILTLGGPVVRSMRVDHVEIPVLDGHSSIYIDHCPYIVAVGYGELDIYDENKNLISLYVENGIVEVSQNVITILVETALYPKEIDSVSINREIENISNQTAINVEESKRNQEKISRLKKRLYVSQKITENQKS